MNDGLKVQEFRTYPAAVRTRQTQHLVSSAKAGQIFDLTAPWFAVAAAAVSLWVACFGA